MSTQDGRGQVSPSASLSGSVGQPSSTLHAGTVNDELNRTALLWDGRDWPPIVKSGIEVEAETNWDLDDAMRFTAPARVSAPSRIGSPKSPSAPMARNNAALDDYHMQLTLLEEENKKRLRRAYQEVD